MGKLKEEWIPVISGRTIEWLEPPGVSQLTQNTQESANTISAMKVYQTKMNLGGIPFVIEIRKPEGGSRLILSISRRYKENQKKAENSFKFEISLQKGWKVIFSEGDGEIGEELTHIEGFQIRSIIKTDSKNGGPRYAKKGREGQDENITGFEYFNYLQMGIPAYTIVLELKRSLVEFANQNNT